MLGTQVRSLVWEDSTGLGKLACLEPVVCNKTSHHHEKPPHNNEDPAQPTVNKLIIIIKGTYLLIQLDTLHIGYLRLCYVLVIQSKETDLFL